MHRLTLIFAIVLSGCVSIPKGVEMTDDERKACAEAGCTVWIKAELEQLVGMAMQRGFQAGRRGPSL